MMPLLQAIKGSVLHGNRKLLCASSNIRKLPMLFYSIRINNDVEKKVLNVTWDDQSSSLFPHIYLRDNCQCPQCFHPSALQRLITDSSVTQAYDISVTAKAAQLISNDQQIQIDWKTEDHVSIFDVDWLKARRFPKSDDAVGDMVNYGERRLWGGELNDKIPTTDFESIINDDIALYNWLRHLADTGLTLIKNVPTKVGQVERLADRVSFPRVTNYGRTFTVESKSNPSNLAYTNHGLALHTDLPFYNLVPGIQMLHCVKQASGTGGENQFVDGFHVAEIMRRNHREFFDLLSRYSFIFFDIGKDYVDYNQLYYHPVIRLNEKGDVIRFIHNNHTRSSLLDVPEDKVIDIYRAFHKIVQVMYDPANLVCNKMESGDMVVFDNWRVLHGRSPFTVTARSSRHLEGIYVDWDEATSRMRSIEQKMKLNSFTGVI